MWVSDCKSFRGYLRARLGNSMGEEFNPYYKWLAIPLDEQPPNHYRLLGVTQFESSPDVIANAADQRMAFLRTFQSGPKSALSQKLLNEIAAARLALLDPKRKTPYDESLRAQLGAAAAAAMPAPPIAPPLAVEPPPVPVSAPTLAPAQAKMPQPAPLRQPVLVAPPAIPVRPSAERADVEPAAPRYELVPRLENDRPRRQPARQPARKNPLVIVAAIVGLLAVVTIIALAANGSRSPAQVAVDDRSPESEQNSADADSPPVKTTARRRVELDPEPQPAVDPDPEPEPQVPAPEPARPEPPSSIPAKVGPAHVGDVKSPQPQPQPVAPPSSAPPSSTPPSTTPQPAPHAHEVAAAANARLAEPAADALAAAHVQIKEVFRQELAEASSPGLKRNLAESLLKQAEAGQDEPPIRFGLYQLTLHLAGEAAEVGLALETIDSFSAAFAVDPHALRLQTLQQMSKTAKPADQLSIGQAALDQVHRATQADELTVAEKLTLLAQTVATKTKDAELRKAAAARLADVKKVEHLWKEARLAAAALEQDPRDQAANLTYGSYLCLTHGDWAQGLPLLAKGTDGKLNAAARLDLQPAADPAAQVLVGDAWWSLANDDKSPGKTLLLERAGHWYQQAAPHLTGLTQTRIEKRLQEIASHAHEEPLGRRPPAMTASKMLDIPLAAGDASAGTVLHLRWMPAGKFLQGSPPGEPGHQPFETQHEVVLTRPFFIGTTEVTQAQWQAVMGGNPSNFKGPDIPVHNVTYTAAKEFCERLDHLPANRGKYQFRLPTSAEWEYACRAGSRGTYCYGNDPALLAQYAWYKETTKGVGGPRPVGQLKPNAAGLYDMHGNVNEWCTDSFSNLILTTRQVDPKGFPGVNQVTRGGHGMASAEECRCAHIFNDPPGKSIDALGFRVVCELSSAKK